jgi:cyclophilin family peptidyl-prolyl cis-trans isomerase
MRADTTCVVHKFSAQLVLFVLWMGLQGLLSMANTGPDTNTSHFR